MWQRCLCIGIAVLILGCSRGPSRLKPPAISASSAASQALAQYDTNKDGKISRDELDKNPALKAEMTGTGTKDGVTAEQIEARIRGWQESKLARLSVLVTATMNGAPLKGATVTLVPEKFLGDTIPKATGTTDDSGVAAPAIPGADTGGVACGYYRIEVSKKEGSKELVPAKYNSQTTLGVEIGPRSKAVAEGISLPLTTR